MVTRQLQSKNVNPLTSNAGEHYPPLGVG